MTVETSKHPVSIPRHTLSEVTKPDTIAEVFLKALKTLLEALFNARPRQKIVPIKYTRVVDIASQGHKFVLPMVTVNPTPAKLPAWW